jgi:hypothetical protein
MRKAAVIAKVRGFSGTCLHFEFRKKEGVGK